MTSHDALAGFWQKDDIKKVEEFKKNAPIDYLGFDRRQDILVGSAIGAFNVAPWGAENDGGRSAGDRAETGATLEFQGVEICKLRRPTVSELEGQVTWLRDYADLREDRTHEILLQAEEILSGFTSVVPFDRPDKVKTLTLVSAAQEIAVLLEMQVKHYCRVPRPADFSNQIHPVVDTPDHSSFPSGHATEAFAMATVINYLESGQNPKQGFEKQVFLLAHRIAVNRTVAGLHFPVDSAAGAALGCAIGSALIALAHGGDNGELLAYGLNQEEHYDAQSDFHRKAMSELVSKGKPVTKPEGITVSEVYADYWRAAREEWT